MNVVVIGGGIIGLSIALELSSRGNDVTVIDRGEPARAASWAAAGMLAPRTEAIADAAMQALCERSLELYPAFAARVRDLSDVDPHLQLDGILHAAFDDAAFDELASRGAALRAQGVDAQVLSRHDVLMFEPAIGKHVRGALLVGGEGQIDNRRLGRALVAACSASGVRIEVNARDVRIEFDSRRVLGVRTAFGYRAADVVVNAAGAWAAQLPGVPAACVPPVHAVKGQMFALQVPEGMMRRCIWVPGAYLVPRRDGRVLVGATVEASEDARVTAGGIDALLHAATVAAPSLRDFTISEMWAGLRPGTPDARPILGATAREGYIAATGHFRNGILLAPVTAEVIAGVIEGREKTDPAFALHRFAAGVGAA